MPVYQVFDRESAILEVECDRKPQVDVAIGKPERRRHHADDRIRGVADSHRPVQDLWIRRHANAPVAIADHHRARARLGVLERR